MNIDNKQVGPVKVADTPALTPTTEPPAPSATPVAAPPPTPSAPATANATPEPTTTPGAPAPVPSENALWTEGRSILLLQLKEDEHKSWKEIESELGNLFTIKEIRHRYRELRKANASLGKDTVVENGKREGEGEGRKKDGGAIKLAMKSGFVLSGDLRVGC